MHPPHERPQKEAKYTARSSAGVLPQAYVNRLESAAACEAAGKRLCTLSEWYVACRGKRRFTYPYGANERRGACNTAKSHLLAKLFGSDPHNWSYAEFNSPRLDIEPGFLAKTGEYKECVSDFGALDMVGNLHEWVQDSVDHTLEDKLVLLDDLRGRIDRNAGHGIFMGGFYSTTNQHGAGCGFVTIGHEPKYHDYSTGFRCCKDPSGR